MTKNPLVLYTYSIVLYNSNEYFTDSKKISCHIIVKLLLLLLLLFGVLCARPRESENTQSVERPQPYTTKPWKEEEDKIVGDKKKSRSCQQESIGSALETRQSHTIKHRVTKIVPKRHREGHKGSAILRSHTTRRRERVPIYEQPKVAHLFFFFILN